MAFATGVACALAVATPASALVELYEHEYLNGGVWYGLDNYTYHDGDTFENGNVLADKVSSIDNWVHYGTCFYLNHHYTGFPALHLVAWEDEINLGSTFNDELSSHVANRSSC